MYGSRRVHANAWDVFPRMPSRVGRGRRPAVDSVVSFGWGGFSVFFQFDFCSLERTRPAASMRPPLAPFTYLLVMRPFFAYREDKFLHTGVRTGCHYLISVFVCLSVSMYVLSLIHI